MTPIDPDDDLNFIAPDIDDDEEGTPPTPPPPAPPVPPVVEPPAQPAPAPAPVNTSTALEDDDDEFKDDPYAKSIHEAAMKKAQKLAEQQVQAMYGMVAPMVQQNAIQRIIDEGNVPKSAVPYLREIVADIPAHLLAGIDAKTVKTFASAAIGKAYTENKLSGDDEQEIVPVSPVGSRGSSGTLTATQKQYAKEYEQISGRKPTRKELAEWGVE